MPRELEGGIQMDSVTSVTFRVDSMSESEIAARLAEFGPDITVSEVKNSVTSGRRKPQRESLRY